jgi:hypothetical protein
VHRAKSFALLRRFGFSAGDLVDPVIEDGEALGARGLEFYCDRG